MKFFYHHFGTLFERAPRLAESLLEKCMPFDITPAADYLFMVESKEHWPVDDYPSLIPPAELCWLEWESPKFILTRDTIIELPPEAQEVWSSVLILTEEIPEDYRRKAIKMNALGQFLERSAMHVGTKGELATATWERQEKLRMMRGSTPVRWMVVMARYSHYTRGTYDPLAADVLWASYLCPLGSALSGGHFTLLPQGQPGFLNHAFVVPHFALSLLNCVNMKPETFTEPLRRRKVRPKGFPAVPPITYRKVHVYPPDLRPRKRYGDLRTKRTESQELVARHFRRGHFKRYYDDRPLFGKYTGVWWWGPAMVGSEKRGVVEKEYIVHRLGGDNWEAVMQAVSEGASLPEAFEKETVRTGLSGTTGTTGTTGMSARPVAQRAIT